MIAPGPVCRAGVCGVREFCGSESDLCGDVDGVCGVMGKGTANSLGVLFAKTGYFSGDFEGDEAVDLERRLVSGDILLVGAKMGRSARGIAGMHSAAWR